MSNKWFVSRQCYWGADPDEANVVEIASGGLDYANPDMLVSKYAGEGTEHTDPREAVTTAIEIAELWKKDSPSLKIGIAHGFTGGYTMPFEPQEVEELKKWAEEAYQNLAKCDQCGELLPEEHWTSTEDPDLGKFCSEYCCDKAVAASNELNEA
jgi:hypothetical protein